VTQSENQGAEERMTGTPIISIVLVILKLAAAVALFLGSSVFYLLGIKRGELSVLFPMV
jgi:hypothetical protein